MASEFTALSQKLNQLTLHDKLRFQRRIQGAKKIKNAQVLSTVIGEIDTEIMAAMQFIEKRRSVLPIINYPENLPVSQKKQEIMTAIRDNQVVIVAGETGSGKTTQLPKMCLELGRGVHGVIGHTQPRRIAARSVANRIAEELKTEVGSVVGYKVRFHDNISDTTLVKLMTDGILLAEIQQDRLLTQYDTIIIDEAHERSLNIDFILGYLRQILPKRPDLKIIITSATIDPQRFSKHFNHAPIIEVSGRTYPVEVRYRPIVDEASDVDREPIQAIIDAVDELTHESYGDILIFMSGEREIRDTADALNKQMFPNTEILPLFARLSSTEQNRIFQPHIGRRIILATNVAETSLTVPGIKYVIDPGMARISRYSIRTKVQRLPIEPISQASANQRKGRCGRISDGICIRLYAEQDFLSRPEFTDPEILRTNLAAVILQMTSLGLGNIAAFPFVQSPDKRNIQDGIRLLDELGAIQHSAENSHIRLTDLGRQLAQLPVDPRLGRMVLEARKKGCVREVLIIVAALSIQDPRERPLEKQQAADEKHRRFNEPDSDFISFVKLWDYLQEQQKSLSSSQFRKQCKIDYLNYLRVREWQDIYAQLRQAVKELGFPVNSQPADYLSLHTALLSGLLSHIGQKDIDKQDFTGARNARFAIFPASGLFKKPPKWAMVAELVETSRLWGRIAARIEPEWIEPLALHLVKRNYSEIHWSKAQGVAVAHERVILYGLTIIAERRVNYSRIDPVVSRELFIRHALVEGDWHHRYAFFRENRKLLAEVEDLEHKSRRRDILVDDDILFNFYDQRIPSHVISSRHFDSWWKKTLAIEPELLNFEKSMLFKSGDTHISKLDYPNNWQQGNFKLKLSYQFEPGANADGVTVHIPLAILNQVAEQGFDWQIPGLRKELVIALIKSLPKGIRRHLVPAPNYAQAFLERVASTMMQGSLLEALEREFRRMTGITIEREQWQLNSIPDHLKITFRIIDEKHKTLAEGKDLSKLKASLKQEVQQTLSTIADDGIEQDNLHIWSFGSLPQYYQQKRNGYEVKAFPGLVDDKDSVAIKLFETEHEQQQSMWAGCRRLLQLTIPSPIKYLHEKLPNKAKLGLYFNPFGSVLELIDDCISCAIDKLMTEHGGIVWDEQKFEHLREYVRTHLNETVVTIARQVETVLYMSHNINKRLKGRVDIQLAVSLADVKSQLSRLIYKGFVTGNGWQRLPDVTRYLQAIERRLEKLPQDPQRDRVLTQKIDYIQNQYQQLLMKLSSVDRIQPDVIEIRWMFEELRVSYFAQQLGTAYTISDKRILQAIEQVSSQY